MRKRIAAIATCAAAMGVPVAAQGSPRDAAPEPNPAYEKRYLEVREKLVDRVGRRQAGRNIVVDGFQEKDGDVVPASREEVLASIKTMKVTLNPPEPEPEPAAVTSSTATGYTGGAAASSATAQCESGGDYTAVNPAGYYGAYQFDQSTWDAYAPSGYQGVNPAEAPPEVQDAAATSVPYDAWPNC
jgi:hypothetical protein